MARLLGMVGFVLLVAAGTGGYRAGAQDGALADRVRELAARLAAVEADSVPASRRLGPDGAILGLPRTELVLANPALVADLDLVAEPAERLRLVCQSYDPLYSLRQSLTPMVAEQIPASLVGLECGRVPGLTAALSAPPSGEAPAAPARAPVPARGGLIPTRGPND